MDSVRNATFRIAFRRHMSLCAPFAASRWTDIWRLFYPEMAILTLEKASRAYRTLRGAFLISENGITHFEGQVAGQIYGGFFYLKMAILTLGEASRV